jgi:hypothetical protein
MMVPANSITDEEWDEILATGGDIHEYDEKEDAVAAFAMYATRVRRRRDRVRGAGAQQLSAACGARRRITTAWWPYR